MLSVWRRETIAVPPEEAITLPLPSYRCLQPIQKSKQVIYKLSKPLSWCFFKESVLATAIFKAGLQINLCEHNRSNSTNLQLCQFDHTQR